MTHTNRNGLFISDTTILIIVVLWLILSGNTTSKNRHADALIKVKPNFFKPDDETLEAAG